MEQLKRTPIIIMLCLLSFFSCKPTDMISPRELSPLELEATITAMPEFQLYQQAATASHNALLLNLKNLDKKDAKWIDFMHTQYPSLEIFLTKGESLEHKRYQELTGIDLIERDAQLHQLFSKFILKLHESASYKSEDLAQLIFPNYADETFNNSLEKFFPSCASQCTYEARRQSRIVYSQCSQMITREPTAESICGQKSELTFSYYLAKCLSTCNGF